MKKQHGITLIALVITIIVLLILAGVTIAAITSNESAPNKAVEAREANEAGAAKDAATLVVAEKTQEYYEGKYVGNNETARSSATAGAYANTVLTTAVVKGEYTIQVTGGKLIVTRTSDSKELAKGTINSDGTITWDGTSGGNTNPPVANSINIVGENLPAVGDVVKYAPGSLTTANIKLPEGAKIEGTKLASIESELPAGASLDSTIDASLATEWKVLKTVTDENDNDTVTDVLIIPTTYDTNTLTLTGKDGYNNAKSALNAVSQIYLNPTYAKSARSITVEDVNELEEHEPDGFVETAVFENEFGMNNDLDIVTGDERNTGKIETESNGEILKISGNLYQSNKETGLYSYYLVLVSELLSDKYCWLASRCVGVNSYGCDFYLRYYDSGGLSFYNLFNVDSGGGYGGSFSGRFSVLPVVSLKSGITMTETNEGWALSL